MDTNTTETATATTEQVTATTEQVTATTEQVTATTETKPVQLPAFSGQSSVKVPTFKAFIEGRGHKMDDFKQGEEGKALRRALNAEYELEKSKFSSLAAGALATALASGEYTIPKASRNKSGGITVALTPVKKTSAEKKALAMLEALGYKISK